MEGDFVDPVVFPDGSSMERAEAAAWLEHNWTSPFTGEPLPHDYTLVPNHNLRLKNFVCRFTGQQMSDPMVCVEDGQSYDFKCIDSFITSCGGVHPITKNPLTLNSFVMNGDLLTLLDQANAVNERRKSKGPRYIGQDYPIDLLVTKRIIVIPGRFQGWNLSIRTFDCQAFLLSAVSDLDHSQSVDIGIRDLQTIEKNFGKEAQVELLEMVFGVHRLLSLLIRKFVEPMAADRRISIDELPGPDRRLSVSVRAEGREQECVYDLDTLLREAGVV